ncbi:MAG: ABC transporter permease [Clostridia bacterium]|nr:ABC transporter permease [Clostridia bacterium]
MILRRAWLYVSRNWKRSLILILILTVLLSALAVVFPTWRASMQAQEDLETSLGESFCVNWGISQLTHPHLYESYPSEDGRLTLYRYIGEDYMTQEVLDAILAIDGVVDYTYTQYWWLYFPDLTLKEGLYNTYYLDTPEDDPDYHWHMAGRNTTTVRSANNSAQHEFFDRGSIELVQGRHVQADDVNCVVISRELAELNGLSIGDTITGYTLQLQLNGVGTVDDRWDEYSLEIVGLFDVLGAVDTVMHGTEESIIENQMFCDVTTMAHIQARIDEKFNTPTPEDMISSEILFYVDDPAKLPDILEQVRAIDIVDMSVFDIGFSNPSYTASIQPLRAMRGVMTVLCASLVAAVLLILRFVMKIWFQGRKKEIAILMSLGVGRKKILGQLMLEMLLIVSIAFIGASIVALAAADGVGNYLYSLTSNDDSINDEQYEQATNIWGENYDPYDPFIEIADFSPEEISVEISAGDLLLCFVSGTAATLLVTLSCCLSIVKKKPRQILSSL